MANLPAYAEHLLPSTQTPLEKIFSATAEGRIAGVPAPINLLNDAYAAPAQFLDALAYEVGVDLWNEDWPEVKKRKVIQDTIGLKKILGSEAGIAAYIAIEDGELIDVVVPPQTPFLSKALGEADYEGWLGDLPQLRVYNGDDQAQIAPGQTFIGDNAFVGSAVPLPDSGRDLLGRRAFYYDPVTKTETRITLADLGVTDTTISEKIMVPGTASKIAAFAGSAFVGVSCAAAPVKEATTVSYTIKKANASGLTDGALALTLAASFNPVNTRYERIPVTGERNETQMFVGVDCANAGFLATSDAVVDFYDRFYLADPSVPAPVTRGTTYIGHARLQMQPYRAEMLIDAKESITPAVAILGRFIGNTFVQHQDDTKRDRIRAAIELAKAHRDRIFVDFQVTRTLTLGDRPKLDGTFTLGQRIARNRL